MILCSGDVASREEATQPRFCLSLVRSLFRKRLLVASRERSKYMDCVCEEFTVAIDLKYLIWNLKIDTEFENLSN